MYYYTYVGNDIYCHFVIYYVFVWFWDQFDELSMKLMTGDEWVTEEKLKYSFLLNKWEKKFAEGSIEMLTHLIFQKLRGELSPELYFVKWPFNLNSINSMNSSAKVYSFIKHYWIFEVDAFPFRKLKLVNFLFNNTKFTWISNIILLISFEWLAKWLHWIRTDCSHYKIKLLLLNSRLMQFPARPPN